MCNMHWKQVIDKANEKKRKTMARLNKQKEHQVNAARKLWDILPTAIRMGRWTAPATIIIAKATHFYNEGHHIHQGWGAEVTCKGEPLTIINCLKRVREQLPCLEDRRGIYIITVGAQKVKCPA